MRDFKNVTVAILAGGLGTRLAPIINKTPKVLAHVRKHPFLEYLLYQLNRAHFRNVVLCTGYLGQQVEKTFGSRYKNVQLVYSHEQIPLGTAGGLRYALPLLGSDTVVVMNGDSYCEVDFGKLWQFHTRKKSKASLVLSEVPDISHYGEVKLGVDKTISEFQEKRDGARAGYVNAGIYVINVELIKKIPLGKQLSLEKDIFPNWIRRGFYGYKALNNFIDIGTPERYKRAQQYFSGIRL